ncbi:MAG: hypothetical protein QNK03_21745 [Myxococcota bacterium]|nr:hypothetical protein [Myxococcota bacterium]
MKLLHALLALLALATVLSSARSEAGLVVAIDDPSTEGFDVEIEDGGAGDDIELPGIVGFDETVGGLRLVGSGQSKPAQGSASEPQLLISIPTIQANQGLASVIVTDTDFDASGQSTVTYTGGTTSGATIQVEAFGDAGNEEFGESFSIGMSPILSGQFDASFQGGPGRVGSLTLAADLSFTQAIQTGGLQARLIQEAPEPGSQPLALAALLVLGGLRALAGRRRDRTDDRADQSAR